MDRPRSYPAEFLISKLSRRSRITKVLRRAAFQAIADKAQKMGLLQRPGTAFGYHALVMAALSGEVVRRATGRTVQEHFTERVRDLLHQVDFFLGLPEDRNPVSSVRYPHFRLPKGWPHWQHVRAARTA